MTLLDIGLMKDYSESPKYNTIMLLDDSELNNLLNTQFLNFTLPATRVTAFEDGSLLLKLLVNRVIEIPDLILLDVNMPEVNGWEFLEELEVHGIETDVIMLSSSRHLHDINKSREYSRVKGYIDKPLTEDKIAAQIIGHEAH